MAQDWTIRPAGVDDAHALSLIGCATFLESFAGILAGDAIVAHCAKQHDPQTYRGYIAAGAKAWLAEAVKGAPIAYALLTQPELPGAQIGDIELKRIYALSLFHGSGVGPKLMDTAVNAASQHRRLLLGVYRYNERALAFYRKHDFEPIGTRQFDVGGRLYDDLVLAKPLS